MRMVDLALGGGAQVQGLFLVAPDEREEDVRRQLARPAMQAVAGLNVRYLPYGELARNREAVARFGQGLKPIEALARRLS
jgi:type II restriction enzyme